MLTLSAYAKINLALDVLGKRQDGYHAVDMIMQSLLLADSITLEEAEEGISLSTNIPDLPCDHTNLAYRAAALVQAHLPQTRGIKIHIEKHIPIAAGLAGGSTDAAAVLAGLNMLWKLGMPMSVLQKWGADLGSDVPFCLVGGTMRATGRGELLTPLPAFPDSWIVLAKPAASVSTAWVYGNYQKDRVKRRPNMEELLQALNKNDKNQVCKGLCNVLESVTILAHPAVGVLKAEMQAAGAAALMSGSGPTVFGICEEEQQARQLAKQLTRYDNTAIFVTRTVKAGGFQNGTAIAPH